MKTIFTTIAIGLAALNANASHNSSALNLKMFGNGNFSVVLDNQASYVQTGLFSANQIEPGNHKLKVIRYYPHPHGMGTLQKVMYSGWITIPAKSVVYANIIHHQFNVVKVEPYFYPPFDAGCDNGWNDECDDEYGYGYDNSGYEGNGWSTTNCGNGWVIPIAIGTVPPVPPMPMCMLQMEFMQLKSSIANKSFESSKLQIAKQALAGNYFSSAQVADLMREFDFETTRLDFAKSAYPRVIDKQNYYQVNNGFTFESSIQDLNQYIAMGK